MKSRSVDRGGSFQIDLLPLPTNNPLPDLPGALMLLVHVVAVVELLQAGRAMRSMIRLEAAMQTFVAHAIAIAITGLLINRVGNLGGQLIGVRLVRILEVGSP